MEKNIKEKKCPKCGRVYIDETLIYCLADGSFLYFPEELEEKATDAATKLFEIQAETVETPAEAPETPTAVRNSVATLVIPKTEPSFPQDLSSDGEAENNSVVTQIPAAQIDAGARFFPTEAQTFAERTGGGKKNNLSFALIGAGILGALVLIGIIGYSLSNSGGAAANKLSGRNNSSNANTSGATAKVGDAVKNSIGMEFMYIPAGNFMMGSSNGRTDEKPVHQVTISRDFWMGRTEVTQAQWEAVMDDNPSFFKDCPNCPVETVFWEDVQQFVTRLNKQNDGFKYRLPTEAEWEYAARAGTTGDYAGNLDAVAWYSANSGDKTHEVATKQANGWGLYDMHGNIWEWTADWFENYPSGAVTDPTGATSGLERVLRGGGYNDDAARLSSASRYLNSPSNRFTYMGFRVVRQ